VVVSIALCPERSEQVLGTSRSGNTAYPGDYSVHPNLCAADSLQRRQAKFGFAKPAAFFD